MTVTGVPFWTFAKKIFAMFSGMRMQPCESGTPGRKPWCMPTPGANCMKYGIDAPLEHRSGRAGIDLHGDIFLHGRAGGRVHVIAVEVRRVIEVLEDDLEIADGRFVALSAAGDRGDADELAAFVERGRLLGEVDHDGGRALDAVAIPIRVRFRERGGLAAADDFRPAAKIGSVRAREA